MAGPVVPLTDSNVGSGGPGESPGATVGLRAGEAVAAPSGRADDFSWPRRHRYFHKLYALDITLDLRDATKSQIERAMQGHVLANAELIGTYQKGDR